MTIHANRNTVSGQIDGRPLNMVRSIASTPMSVVSKQLVAYMKTVGPAVRPEEQALRFYMLEHAAGIVRALYAAHDTLPDGVVTVLDMYNKSSLQMAARAYYYLLLICWREMRYCGSGTKDAVFQLAGQHAGADPVAMQKLLNQCSEGDALTCAKRWDKVNDITLGQLTKALIYAYRKGKWGSAYGGPKWANVTACLDSFVWGTTSAAMMLDTVWTLAHNTAPIFNKAVGLYSGQDNYTLLEILDVQRAGMIPQYIKTAKMRKYKGADYAFGLKHDVELIGTRIGGVFAENCDVHWPTVTLLGGKGGYGGYADALNQKDPPASDVVPLKKALDAKTKFTSKDIKTGPYTGPNMKKIVPGVTVSLGRMQEAV